MKKNLFLTIPCLLFALVCLSATAGLSGKWTGSIKLPDGKTYLITYVLVTQGDSLSGTAQADGDPKPVTNGKVNGTDFVFNITNDDGQLISHSGKYYATGDSVSMNVVFQGAKLHSTLKRADQ